MSLFGKIQESSEFSLDGLTSLLTVECLAGWRWTPVSSEAVAEAAQDWRETLAHYYPHVRAWFSHVLIERTAVEDLTQEVFVRICDRFAKGEAVLNPWNFIKVTARNVFMEHLRAQRHQKAFLPMEEGIAVDELPEASEVCAHQEASEAIPQLLAHLRGAQRYILVGRYFLGLTVRELAEAMGTAASTVVERHNRAVCQLRKLALSRGISL
jgi:RNA polymerase sigma factor (sigma-70 family)